MEVLLTVLEVYLKMTLRSDLCCLHNIIKQETVFALLEYLICILI